jgi:glycosyltransferase involved in cell wall biosynthesis
MTPKDGISLSIVTVCRNDLTNVQHTMASLMQQTERHGWEHVLIDGLSTDGTVDWYRSADWDFPHRVISEADTGIYDAMNKSLDMVNGDYIVFMNAGDRYADEEAISRTLRRIGTKPAWGYSRARVVEHDGRTLREYGRIPYSRVHHLLGRATFCHQAVVMRVDLLRELGGFDESFRIAADYHLLIKAAGRVRPITWRDMDVDYLTGGISHRHYIAGAWEKHRARVDALQLGHNAAKIDEAWTRSQIGRMRVRKRLKPFLGPAYSKLKK